MKKRLMMLVLALTLVFSMMPFGFTEVFAADGNTVHTQIEALPDASSVTLKDYADFDRIMADVHELTTADDPAATAGITEDDVNKLQEISGRIFDLRAKIIGGKVKGVKVTAGKKKATVSWKKFTKTGATYKYVIYRGTEKYGNFKKVGTTTSTKKVIKNLKKGKRYYFYVVAIGSFKNGAGKTEKLESEESTYVRSKKIK